MKVLFVEAFLKVGGFPVFNGLIQCVLHIVRVFRGQVLYVINPVPNAHFSLNGSNTVKVARERLIKIDNFKIIINYNVAVRDMVDNRLQGNRYNSEEIIFQDCKHKTHDGKGKRNRLIVHRKRKQLENKGNINGKGNNRAYQYKNGLP